MDGVPAAQGPPAELDIAQKTVDLAVGEGEDAAVPEGLVVEEHRLELRPAGTGGVGADGGEFLGLGVQRTEVTPVEMPNGQQRQRGQDHRQSAG